jgi:hypothetical protein
LTSAAEHTMPREAQAIDGMYVLPKHVSRLVLFVHLPDDHACSFGAAFVAVSCRPRKLHCLVQIVLYAEPEVHSNSMVESLSNGEKI